MQGPEVAAASTSCNIEKKAEKIAEGLEDLLGGRFNKFQALVVVSLALQRCKARDLDFEIFGVPHDDLVVAMEGLKKAGTIK